MSSRSGAIPAAVPTTRAASAAARVRSQAAFEARGLLSHGEQLLVSVVLPALALIGLALTTSPSLGPGRRIDLATAGIIGLAVISTAFTGQAILLAYERRYGVLRLLGTTPLGRGGLLAGKALAVLVVIAVQLAALGVLAAVLGWRPEPAGLLPAVIAVTAGAWAFAALAVVVGGTLRAEGVLAAANVLWVLFLVAGGVLLPADRLPGGWGAAVSWLPSSALGDALRAALIDGAWPWADLGLLLVWAVLASVAGARILRWSD